MIVALALQPPVAGAQVVATPLPQSKQRVLRELRRYPAPEAHQAVGVDRDHFFAIGDREIGKYEKANGKKVTEWRGPDGGPIHHLNSGVVIDGRLYCAHSNYPELPMTSSIEIFDTDVLRPVRSQSFGVSDGSATWVDRRDGRWWVTFAHYGGRGGQPGKGSDKTSLVAFDDEWRRVAAYTFPTAVVKRFRDHSNSGGSWGRDGFLYATGHDAPEVYVLKLPTVGTVLDLVDTIPAPIAGQGIARDPGDANVLWGIVRARHEVVVSRLVSVP